MEAPLNILFIEDSENDMFLLLDELRQGGYTPSYRRVDSAETMQAELHKQQWDLIIADYRLPSFNAPDALMVLQANNLDIPLIVVSGMIGEDVAVTMMKAGAHDYVMKGNLSRLVPAVSRAIAEAEARQEHQRAEKELRTREQFLELLNDITRAALETPDYMTMLQILAHRLSKLFNADGAYITEWDNERQLAIPMAASDATLQEQYRQIKSYSRGATITELVLRSGQVLIVEDLKKTSFLKPRIAHPLQVHSLLGLPLIAGEEKLGAAIITFEQAHTFTATEIAQGTQAAAQISLAIAKARLLEQLQQSNRELSRLYRASDTLLSSTTPNLQSLAQIIVETVLQEFEQSNCSLLLVEPDQSPLNRIAVAGPYSSEVSQLTLMKEGQGLVPAVIRTGRILNVGDVHNNPDYIPGWESARSELAIPLKIGERVIGVIDVQSTELAAFNHDDVRLISTFAERAALALENARLYERLQHHAAELEQHVAKRTRELALANERLTELDRLKTKFVSDVSHELRTPVSNLKLYLDLLKNAGSQKQDHYMATLEKQTNRLQRLIEDTLELSRLEVKKTGSSLARVDLNRIIESVLTTQHPYARTVKLQLQFEPEADLPSVWGNADQLAQVITNLVTNALNYTNIGYVRVRTLMDSLKRHVGLRVEDTGMGIAPEEQRFLFDRFYRGNRVSQLNIPGTGLGLAIVKEIIDSHEGIIEIESQVDQGSAFTVWLPIQGPEMNSIQVEA